ncbi:MAG: hypothetical protein GDA53_05035 [Rhodobacteraceae bacterium]|nr:hypothetical protein [Paracoccaceae bacterium]
MFLALATPSVPFSVPGEPRAGKDALRGDAGDDLPKGARGDDFPGGGSGDDTMGGCPGAYTLVFSQANSGEDVIHDFAAELVRKGGFNIKSARTDDGDVIVCRGTGQF